VPKKQVLEQVDSMNIQVIRPEELTARQIKLWVGMMNAEDVTDSPFFHPGYIITLSRFREPVRVAVVTENGEEVAFFPFERQGGTGRPLGVKLCDFQGIVRSPGTVLDTRELLAGCGLKTWIFDHVVASQPEFRDWQLRVEDSPYVDISEGFDAYTAQQKEAGHKTIARIRKKQRKVAREVGPIRFEWHSSDPEVFQKLLEWQSAQRKNTGTFDILQFEWVVKAMDAIRRIDSEDFGGVLSSLHINNTLAAVFFSMRTATVLHQWVVAYNVNLRKYSPGNLLHLLSVQAAAERGIKRVDLGRGGEPYKKRQGTGVILVGEGAVDLNPLRHMGRSFLYKTYKKICNSRLYELSETPRRQIRNFTKRKSMDS